MFIAFKRSQGISILERFLNAFVQLLFPDRSASAREASFSRRHVTKFIRRQFSWATIMRRTQIVLSALLIVSFVISPVGIDEPRPVQAAEPITLAALASFLMGHCALGMAGSMISWSISHGGPLYEAANNPEFRDQVGRGCFFGVIFWWVHIPGVRGWIAEVLFLPTDYAVGEAAEAAYQKWGKNVIPVVIDNWKTLLVISSPPLLIAYNLLVDEADRSQDIYNLMHDIAELWHNDTGGGEIIIETVPVQAVVVDSPPGGKYFQYDTVSAEVIYSQEMNFCTDEIAGTVSDIKYVQFGYSFTQTPGSVQPLPSPNANGDGKDWYGCNGWGLEFDIKQIGITGPTPIYIAVRAEDTYGTLSNWQFSAQYVADPRFVHDYSVSNIQLNPASPNANQSVQVSATIQNSGASNEGSVRVAFYVDNQEYSSHNINALNAGTSTPTSFNWTATQGAHTLRIEAQLNGDNYPDNNSASKTMVIGTAPLIKVNGSTTPPAFVISATTAGTSDTFTVSVQNVGGAPTNISVSKGGTRSSWLSLTSSSFPLGANSTTTYSFSANIPANQPVGTQTAEIYFDWASTRTTLPVQFNISQFAPGDFTHPFSSSSGTIDGRSDFIFQPVMRLYEYLDNDSNTTRPTYVDGYFSFPSGSYHRALEACNWEVGGIENQASGSSGISLSFNSSTLSTRTSTFAATCFPIFSKLINGPNYWKIGLTGFTQNANNVQWEVERNTIYFPIVKGAWADGNFAPGNSTVQIWQDGWDYGRVCGTVGTVTTAGNTDLYNNGVKVAPKAISTSDAGREVCWTLSSSEVSGSNYYNLKPNGGTIFTISNMHFDVHYFTGQPSLKATRLVSPQSAQVGQNIAVTVSLYNNGSNIADNPDYADSLPAGLQLTGGSLSGRIADVNPSQTQSAGYTVSASSAGVYTIPSSTILYQDKANNDYQTTLPSSTIEVWGGTLQPILGTIADTVIGNPALIYGTVTDSLSGGNITDATILANITKPNGSVETVALPWNGANNRFEANYYPSLAGQHQVTLTASKPYYTAGTSLNRPFSVSAPNNPPIASIAVAPTKGPSPLTVILDGRASIDVDGVLTSYEWDIDDNGSVDTTGATSQWTLNTLGIHPIKLIVTDNKGATSSATTTVELVQPLPPPANLTANVQSTTSVRLDWQDMSSNETRFEIERSSNEFIGWAAVGQMNSNVVTYLDTGLTCENQYYYRVRAYRSSDAVYSAYSNIVPVQTPSCPVAPEMDVKGNNVSIADGDITPSPTDHTDFGSLDISSGTLARTFTIYNTGTANLNLNGTPKVSVTGCTGFTVSAQPATGTIVEGGSTAFTITFDPNVLGTCSATISIANTDSDEDPYDFAIQGTGTLMVTQLKSAGIADGWVLETSENSNQGGALQAGAATFVLGDDAGNRQYRSILHFNTSSLPDNAVITRVVLKIKKHSLTGTDPFTTHLKIAVDIRKGAFSNLGALQATDFQAAASKPGVGSFANNPRPGGWYVSPLKSIAYPYINRTGITQLRLRFQTDDDNDAVADFLRFYSGNSTVANRPVLVIEYYVP
jgi:uncharacterized repeat protein (TIGR01451 family)